MLSSFVSYKRGPKEIGEFNFSFSDISVESLKNDALLHIFEKNTIHMFQTSVMLASFVGCKRANGNKCKYFFG